MKDMRLTSALSGAFLCISEGSFKGFVNKTKQQWLYSLSQLGFFLFASLLLWKSATQNINNSLQNQCPAILDNPQKTLLAFIKISSTANWSISLYH